MRNRGGIAPSALLTIIFILAAPAQLRAHPSQFESAFGRLPLYFEENVGQSDARVRFLARGAGYSLFLTSDETVAVLQPHEAETGAVVRMRLGGANEQPVVRGEDLLPGRSNYFAGNDSSRWRTNVPQYAKVRMDEVYRGIDVVYYGNQHQLEYDFVVKPGADPGQIRLRFEGAERIDLDAAGNLVLHVAGGELRQSLPAVYQELRGVRQRVPATYRRLSAREFGIDLDDYDPARPLVIDPTLVYSTYLGGSAFDQAHTIAIDSSGNSYVAGLTASTNFPTTSGAFQTASGGNLEGFVAKLNSAGTGIVFATYLGGSGVDEADGIAVDSAGNVYLTGRTLSGNFPTTAGAFQTALGGNGDSFAAKLNSTGTALIYSTYLGGVGEETAGGIAVDGAGSAYVSGLTTSLNFPTTAGAFQTAFAGSVDVFVTKLNATGTALVYSTYLGGSDQEIAGPGMTIAIDSSGNAYVTGLTLSTNFPTTAGAFQTVLAGSSDAFVTRLNGAGTALVYSTYLGGSGQETGNGIAVNSAGDAYVAGNTGSANFPTTAGALQTLLAGTTDAFVTRLNGAGTALVYSTYLGGSAVDVGQGVAVDSAGDAYVAGRTTSANFPTTASAFQAAHGGNDDAFVARLNATGSALRYSTYLGGSAPDLATGIAVDVSANAYVTGLTQSANFPTANPLQPAMAGGQEAFVAKIATAASDLAVTKSDSPDPVNAGDNLTYTVNLTNNGPDAASSVIVTDTLPANTTFVSASVTTGSGWSTTAPPAGATGDVVFSKASVASAEAAVFQIVVRVNSSTPNGTIISNTATAATTTADPTAGNNSSTATTTVSTSADVSVTKIGPPTIFAGTQILYTVDVTNNGPSDAQSLSLTDALPPGTTFQVADPQPGPAFTCSTPAVGGTGTVTCTLATLPAGATATLILLYNVSPSLASGTTITNTASVSAATADPAPGNNSQSTSATVSTAADLVMTKSGPPTVVAGTDITYSIGVTNNGPSDAQSLTLSDALPAGTTFVSGAQNTGPAFTCSNPAVGGTGSVNCTLATLPAGATATFTLVFRAGAGVASGTTITNTASVSATTSDSTPGNNTQSSAATVGSSADLSVTKSGPASTPSNTNVTYVVTAANVGPSDAATVTLTDTLPAGMTFVSVNQTSGPAFACSGSGPIVCTIPSFAAGANASFQLTFFAPSTIAVGTSTMNTVTISSTTPDSNPSNNTASAPATIGQSIPALSPMMLSLLAALIALLGAMRLSR